MADILTLPEDMRTANAIAYVVRQCAERYNAPPQRRSAAVNYALDIWRDGSSAAWAINRAACLLRVLDRLR